MEFFDSKKVEKAHNVIVTITQSSGNDLIRRADALKAFDDNIVWGAPRVAIMKIPAVKQPISAEEYEARRDRYIEWCSNRSCAKCPYNKTRSCWFYLRTPKERVDFVVNWSEL